jgi:DNA repair protein SbcC/Rad50
MISWFFKKKYGHPDLPTTAQPAPKPASSTTPSAAPSAKKPRPAAEDRPEEQAQLAAALGNDAGLLVVAQTVQSLTVKLAAVQALSGEDTLRLAERHFRNQDRKVHRLAKQRLETAVQQRQGREQAQSLLARTATMLADPLLPINHVVTLDREWQALKSELLLPEQRTQFAELRRV